MEHGLLDIQVVQRMIQAVGNRSYCIVRVPSGEEVWIKRVLETGCDGILVPHINNADEARSIIKMAKYPPQGSRSAGIARAQSYGFKFQQYIDTANENIAVILQIEDIYAVRNIESIVSVSGFDAVFIGPYDLSGSMNKLGKVKDPEVLQAIDEVCNVCFSSGLAVGIFGIDAESVKSSVKEGFTLICVGMDTLFLSSSAKNTLNALNNIKNNIK